MLMTVTEPEFQFRSGKTKIYVELNLFFFFFFSIYSSNYLKVEYIDNKIKKIQSLKLCLS